jgi:phage terminase small subunit
VMGRPPTPTALKVLTGTAAHNPQRVNRDEPKPALGATPPPWLPRRGPARAAWDRLSPILLRMRVLTEADAEALGLGCLALAEYLQNRRDPTAWRKGDAAWKRYWAVLAGFGMNPSARAKVSTAAPEAADPFTTWAEAAR